MDSYQRLIDGLDMRPATERPHRGGAKAIRSAVAGLPLANPAQAASEVEQLLDGLLGSAWVGAERIAALEDLRRPVSALCADVERRIGAESHPLPQASAEWAASAQRLQGKLVSGYAIALYELCAPDGRLPRFRGKHAATAAVRGLVHADTALLWAYRLYSAPPAGLWQRAHTLYAFARDLDIATRGIADDLPGGQRQTAHDAYAQLVLLAICNPYRFSTRELDEARQVCRAMAPLCAFTREGGTGFAVDTGSDAGPGYIPEERVDAGSGMLSVDVAPVEQALDERVALLPGHEGVLDLPLPDGGRVSTSARFVNHLRAGWGKAPRGHKRLSATHALDIVVGMHALHYALAGDIDFATFVRQVHGDAITVGRHDLPTSWMAASDTARPRVFRGEVLDQSEGGYRMRLPLASGLRLRIGDLIGLAPVVDGADAHDWMVGVIRWLRHDGDSVLLGIELLRRTARAAGVRALTAGGEALTPQRAVELVDGTDTEQLSLLVSHPFAGGVAAVEVALPRLASDWSSRPAVGSWRPRNVEALGPSCFRVTLAPRDDEAGD